MIGVHMTRPRRFENITDHSAGSVHFMNAGPCGRANGWP